MDPEPKNFKIYINDNPYGDLSAQLESTLLNLLEFLSLPKGSVSLSLVNLDEIQTLNKNHRQIDKVTDVLSFPQLELKQPYRYTEPFESQLNPNSDTNTTPQGNFSYGDIVLCPEQAGINAKSIGHSALDEIRFLLVHSVLHLLGFDHVEADDEKLMVSEQTRILKSLRWNQYSTQNNDTPSPPSQETL